MSYSIRSFREIRGQHNVNIHTINYILIKLTSLYVHICSIEIKVKKHS